MWLCRWLPQTALTSVLWLAASLLLAVPAAALEIWFAPGDDPPRGDKSRNQDFPALFDEPPAWNTWADVFQITPDSLACTNIILNMMGTSRHVCRDVKHWWNAAMALRWTEAARQEAAKGFHRLKAHKQLPVLRAARRAIQPQPDADNGVAPETVAA